MWVRHLRLTDFRSYEDLTVTLEQGPVTLVGANGQGKTNVVEAIGYLATLGSHRVASDAPLVRQGAERAVVGAEIVKDDRAIVIELEINPGKANRARLNRAAATRARDILGLLQCVIFAPEDLALVKGDPSDRRKFLDDVLVQRSPRMQAVKADYDRILKQRNSLLKSAHGARRASRESVLATLHVWDEQLAAVGADLAAARVALVDSLAPLAAQHYSRIAGGDAAVSDNQMRIEYNCTALPALVHSADREEWSSGMATAIESRRDDELDRGVTLVGPHRDDLSIVLGDFPAKGFASHGESWSMALALRLACIDLMRADGDDPVLILDDVFAELDAARRRFLLESVQGVSQVIITAAVGEDVPEQLAGQRLTVTKGHVDA